MRSREVIALLALLGGCATATHSEPNDESPSPNAGSAGLPSSAGATASAGSLESAGSVAHGGSPASAGSGSAGSAGKANGGAGGASGGSAGTSSAGTSSAGASSAGMGSAGTGSAGTSSAGATGVLFSDDFEDGNANGWIPDGGTWAITTDGSKVYAQQANGTGSALQLSAAGSSAWTDQVIEARVKVLSFGGQSTSYFAAIYARFNGTDYYALTLRSDGKVAIRKNTTTLGSAVSAGITAGTWYSVRFEVVGSTLKAYVDGELKDTESDASLSAGGIAISAVNTTAEFDDVAVRRN